MCEPILEHSSSDQRLQMEFTWGGVKPGNGVGETILEAEHPQLPEPGLGTRRGGGEDTSGSDCEHIVPLSKPADLSKHGEHSEVQLGLQRETSCQHVEGSADNES